MKKQSIFLYAASFGLGWVGAFVSLILMNSFPAWISITAASLIFLALGTLVNGFKLNSRWLAWLLLCIGLLVIFLPFYQVFGTQTDWSNPDTQILLLKITGLIVLPMASGLAGALHGNKMLEKLDYFTGRPGRKEYLKKSLSGFVKMLLPIAIGFLSLFIVMFSGFLAHSLGAMKWLPYFAFLIFMVLAAGFLGYIRDRWFSDCLLLFVCPVYFGVGTRVWGHFNETDWWNFSDAYFLSIVVTVGALFLSMLAAYLVHHRKSKKT